MRRPTQCVLRLPPRVSRTAATMARRRSSAPKVYRRPLPLRARANDGEPLPGVYAVRWIKRGATRILGTNKRGAERSAASPRISLRALPPPPNAGREQIDELLAERKRTLSQSRAGARSTPTRSARDTKSSAPLLASEQLRPADHGRERQGAPCRSSTRPPALSGPLLLPRIAHLAAPICLATWGCREQQPAGG
jgi:hypothetical protein